MTELVRYDAACRAIAEARSVDEVKDIRDKSIAMQAYARQAKNRSLEADASEIRLRAERRVGQMMKTQKETVGLAKGAAKKRGVSDTPRLTDVGIDKNLAKQARKLADMDDEEFDDVVADTRVAVTNAARKVVEQKTKKADRDAREMALANSIMEWPTKKYGLAHIDPPWRIEPYSRKTGLNKAPDNHYPTMTIEQLMELDVGGLFTKHGIIFMCAITPMLDVAIDLMRHWGFTYKSHFVWRKIRPGEQTGTGYWNVSMHELLLIGTRGDIPAPAPGDQWESVIEAPVGKHSEKPEEFYKLIEAYFPNLPKIELFARQRREGWDSWGNEVDARSA